MRGDRDKIGGGSSLVHGSDYLIQKFPGYPLNSRGLYGLSRTRANKLTLVNECNPTLACMVDGLAWTGLDGGHGLGVGGNAGCSG